MNEPAPNDPQNPNYGAVDPEPDNVIRTDFSSPTRSGSQSGTLCTRWG